jgi:anhydro-N-acetylmuramic acid kinase
MAVMMAPDGSDGGGAGLRLVIGLMSGTSADAVDAALIETDGETRMRAIAFIDRPYSESEQATIRAAARRALELERPGPDPLLADAEWIITHAHAEAVAALPGGSDATLIGFHGQTVAHRPPHAGPPPYFSWQIGDAAMLARLTGRPVVHDFRGADVAAGGEGAPLAPGFHRALAGTVPGRLGVLNLGGVANLTWLAGERWGAFDTGPANGLLDDWVALHGLGRFDRDGWLSGQGIVHEDRVALMAANPWFGRAGPKSLDRGDFTLDQVADLSPADGAATLAAFTAETVARALDLVPARPERLLLTGGGRHNPVLVRMIAERSGAAADPVEAVGWQGDALEAQAFGWLAVRHVRGLPLSWPETTGVPEPMPGGRLAVPA